MKAIKKPFFYIFMPFLCICLVYNGNEREFALIDVWRVLFILIAISFVFQFIFSRFLSKSAAALTVSTLILAIAFPYENALCQKMLLALIPILLFIFYKFDFKLGDSFTALLNLFTTVFLILLMWKIGSAEYDPKVIEELIKNFGTDRFIAGENNFDLSKMPYYSDLKLASKAEDIQLKNKPNIYHIVLDTYASDKVLKNIYGYDNSDFSNELRSLGFYVSENTHSTYNQTSSSMSSVFYKSNVTEEEWYDDSEELTPPEPAKGSRLLDFIIGFGVVHTELKNNGYSFARSVIEPQQIRFPPIYSTYRNPEVTTPRQYNVFEYEFFRRRFYWGNNFTKFLKGIDSATSRFSWVYLTTSMSDPIPKSQPPFFYYQHNLAPHDPFNATEDGQFTIDGTLDNVANRGKHNFGGDDGVRRGYINKLRLANTLVLKKIKQILESDGHSKIIIVHGDHGSKMGQSIAKDGHETSCLYDRYSPYFAIYYDGRKDIDKYFDHFNLPDMYPRIYQMINHEPVQEGRTHTYYFIHYPYLHKLNENDLNDLSRCPLFPERATHISARDL